MLMNTAQLQCFLTVADTLNFARAAQQLHITQPAVTQQIHALEKELGVQLFHRTTHSVRLTDEGMVFLGDARQIEKCLRLVDNEIRRLASDSLKQHTLNAAKKQYIGQLLVGSESVEGFALSTGKNVLYFGKAGSVKETTERINAIAIDEIRDIAAGIADNLSTLIYL